MTTYLILEDEILISDQISRTILNSDLLPKPVEILQAQSVSEAIGFLGRHIDIAILDIRLYGDETGIDFARYLNKIHQEIPFIFLTSQFTPEYLAKAMSLNPVGYLSKPVQPLSLEATIVLALKGTKSSRGEAHVMLESGGSIRSISTSDILYLEVSHVYVSYHIVDSPLILVRESLAEAEAKLDSKQFLKVHRSFIVNRLHVDSFSMKSLVVSNRSIPISRSRQKEIYEQLLGA